MSLKERMKGMFLRDEDRMVREVVSSASTSILDSIIDTHSAIKILAVTVTAEFVALAMFYVSKDKVQDFLAESEGDALIYGSVAVFVIGFLTAFAAYRLIEGKLRQLFPKITIWLISIAAGVANLLLFFLLISFRLR